MTKRDMRGTWPQALRTFLIPIVLVMAVRWLLFEPYTIPSGSMIPNLLIHDYIFVNKLMYGVRWPFSKKWIVQWSTPKRGEIIVFRYPENEAQFFIKRVVGLPGDKIEVRGAQVLINGQLFEQTAYSEVDPAMPALEEGDESSRFIENNGQRQYVVQFREETREMGDYEETEVPAGHLFVMGDHRDESSDSRRWGFVPIENLMGEAQFIWLSCEQTLASSEMICDPKSLRMSRILRKIR